MQEITAVAHTLNSLVYFYLIQQTSIGAGKESISVSFTAHSKDKLSLAFNMIIVCFFCFSLSVQICYCCLWISFDSKIGRLFGSASFDSIPFSILWNILKKAQAALMYDAVFVLVEAFNKLLRKKPDQFRSYTMRNRMGQLLAPITNVSSTNATNNANVNRVLDCNTSKGWVNPWEHGDKISRYLRKVHFIYTHFIQFP